MWFVNIRNRQIPGHGKWHFLRMEDDAKVACGAPNPPWFFRFDGDQWQQADRVEGIPIRRWFGGADYSILEALSAERRCGKCWRIAQEDRLRNQRAALVADRLAEGRAEVTLISKVVLRDLASHEEVHCCFAPRSGATDETWVCTADSSLGMALLGRFVGDEIAVDLPDGRSEYTILRAEPPPA